MSGPRPGALGVVWFIGAGPGDPELLTLRGRRRIASADLVLYAGSLVNPDVLGCVRDDAVVRDTRAHAAR